MREPELGNRPTGDDGKVAGRTLGSALDLVGNVLESLLAPQLTPEQKREAEIVEHERKAEVGEKTSFDKYQADRAAERQRLEQERAAGRLRERDDRDR